MLLNVYLHHHLDRRWRRKHADVPLLRWADDLLVLCRTQEEAQQVYQDLKSLLLPAGMRLKSDPERAIHDLAGGDRAEWLGFRLSKGAGGLKVTLTDKAWKSLSDNLGQAHEKNDAPLQASWRRPPTTV